MPVDHLALAAPASKFDACVAFYVAALAPLGYKKLKDFGKFVGLGVSEKPDFWLAEKEGAAETQQTHIAFTANGQ
jgi:hypothetical protein